MAQIKHYAPGPEALGQMLPPSKTAVLVIDIQNDFAHADGVMGKAGVDLSRVDASVAAAARLIAAAHAAAAPVIFISLETTASLDSRPAAMRRARLGMPYKEETRVCRKGQWGAQWYGVAPSEGDVRVAKCRYSSFQDTELDLQLKALGVDTVLVCGLTTECCVETAVRDAFHRDYNVFLVEDACASYDMDLHVASVRTMGLFHALIVKADAVTEAWARAADAAPATAEQMVDV
jgi:ureidoacrylate peracid hydrolase